jgi:hypothetical protein
MSFPACYVFTSRPLVTASNNGYYSAAVLKSSLNSGPLTTEVFFRVRVTLGLAVYRQSVRLGDNPLRLTTSNFILQLNTCGYSPYVQSSLTRGRLCCLQLLLVLARAVIHRAESRGTHDHILLSRIRDSPNLEGQVPVFISPGNMARVYPQALGLNSSCFSCPTYKPFARTE